MQQEDRFWGNCLVSKTYEQTMDLGDENYRL